MLIPAALSNLYAYMYVPVYKSRAYTLFLSPVSGRRTPQRFQFNGYIKIFALPILGFAASLQAVFWQPEANDN